MVKISVIIPVYNAETYLRQCLDSVIGQTMKEIEIICVNDSSTDSSLDILEEYARKDSRIQVITQLNAGAGAARNCGMQAAAGRYLCFLDADDFFEPTLLEKEYELAEADRADFVVCRSDQFHTEKNEYISVNWTVREKEIPPYHPFSHRQMTGNIFKVFVGWAWDKLYRREFVDKYQLKFQEQRTSNDMLFVFSGVALAKRISVVSEVLVHQRRDAKDSLSKTRENSWQCFYYALTALRERLRNEGLYEELEKDFINYALHFTLWNYNTLSEPTKSLLGDKLKSEWFQELGIYGKEQNYFYIRSEYCQYRMLFYGEEQKEELEIIDNKLEKRKENIPVECVADTEYVGMLVRVKRKLRHFVPVGHAYLDKAIGSHEKKSNRYVKKQIELLQKRQEMELTTQKEQLQLEMKQLRMEVNKQYSEMKILNSEMRKLSPEMKKMLSAMEKLRVDGKYYHTEQLKTAIETKNYMEQELHRRDDWAKREAENLRLAKGRQIWLIKCPAPENETKIRWGDYHFALTLKRYLERRNIFVQVDTREDWGCETAGADVVIVLRGCALYRPDRRNEKCLYIMWNISHPDMVTEEEYQLYDVICVGSRHYAKQLQRKLTVPVLPLLQCTDTELFYPAAPSVEYQREYIFIGNSRGIARNCVMWAVQDQLPLRMWGSGWNTILKEHMDLIEAPFIENDRIPELYRTSKVALNDHWKDMLDKQFINNRIFDALACGLPVISDSCEELREIFPEAVLHYTTRAEYEECIRKVETDYADVKKRVEDQWELIKQKYSFETRAEELMAIAEKYRKK